MQGNGKFYVGSPTENVPVRLELQGLDQGFVNLVAVLGDLRVCIACFRNGIYDPQVIPKDKAVQMGIRLNINRHILQAI